MGIKHIAYKILKTAFNQRGISLMTRYEREQIEYNLKNSTFRPWSTLSGEGILSIVFSKDRVMQLNAFIESYLEKVNNYGPLYVLYKSSEKHKNSYENLKKLYLEKEIFFIEEKDFRRQLLDIISQNKKDKIAFYVDDMVFVRNIDYKDLDRVDCKTHIVALSRGKNLNYSTVLLKKLELPDFTPKDPFLEFSWNQFNYLSDWTYPTGVSGYLFDRLEILNILELTEFKAPNSLECAICSVMPSFILRKGLCYPFIACACIPANIVQNECENPSLNYFSTEQLLKLWEDGMKIDLKPLYACSDTVKILNQKYTFVKR